MTRANRPVVHVVDDDAAVRDSIAELVRSIGIASAGYASAAAFLAAFRPDFGGCLVLDVRMAGMSGLALQEQLVALGSTLPVIVITGHGDVPMAVQALKAGATDFIQKPYREQVLLDAIVAALARDDDARRARAGDAGYERALATLTARERGVLELLLAGRTSKGIAQALGISPRTAEAHRRNLLQKFGLASTRELLRLRASLSRHP
ncbi:MAG: response regulator transcription factor [Burkholderiales bacterium]|nr:response regulator transcription factor [Burkholderiales bacterium]